MKNLYNYNLVSKPPKGLLGLYFPIMWLLVYWTAIFLFLGILMYFFRLVPIYFILFIGLIWGLIVYYVTNYVKNINKTKNNPSLKEYYFLISSNTFLYILCIFCYIDVVQELVHSKKVLVTRHRRIFLRKI